ncbi:stage II sporulation protein R [Syntrophobotulus glycolicus DSM 8271]|uniref:Stage II sporulation protein R n=2 Tax=Syntrophobotulus TaxID=51196 RepID=F0SWM0_SYNGF|nr:stage II sporulation protein R [Syntrophobotulus glycolicus DSM 8271]
MKMFTTKKIILLLLIVSLLASSLLRGEAKADLPAQPDASEIIRFHVIANSDSEDDQDLKYAVRDEILKLAAPRLAKSSSLAESREIVKSMEPEILAAAQRVVRNWGRDYSVQIEHGNYFFPAKSYGSIVLPSGEYEAVRIKIGKAEGANWWCILFPPICFVNVEKATAVPVDGKEPRKYTFFLGRFFKNIIAGKHSIPGK